MSRKGAKTAKRRRGLRYMVYVVHVVSDGGMRVSALA
jgi:hypothetical protein